MDSPKIETYYADPKRASEDELKREIESISNHPLIDEVMNASGGMFAVLNKNRQIVAINKVFLEAVGVVNPEDSLGLRLGERLSCVHACEMPGGCGTSQYCSTCGAVIATVTALETEKPVEKICVMKAEKDYQDVDFYFNVRCNPIKIDGRPFLLLYMQDISIHQQWAYLEQTFLHDIANSIQGLLGTSVILSEPGKFSKEKVDKLQLIAIRIANEVAAQKSLSTTLSHSYQPLYTDLSVYAILDELAETSGNHPAASGKQLSFDMPEVDIVIHSDHALVIRVLINMLTNALEASDNAGSVKVSVDADGDTVIFKVWNSSVVTADVAKRIFQRNFSTKSGIGHGLGTYSMKLFGEKVLGGKVDFSSSETEGTTFRFALQIKQ